jgi:hypothetical protein
LAVVSGSASDTGSTFTGNWAIGGTGGSGGNGGDGLGGGIYVAAGAAVSLSASTVTLNQAQGGEEGAGGSDGSGIGGGVYGLGSFSFDPFTVIKGNHASTSHDNIFP